MSNSDHLSAASIRKLERISRNLTAVLLEANRDPRTGTFKAGSSVTPRALRAAWQTANGTDPALSFKNQLLLALRTPRK